MFGSGLLLLAWPSHVRQLQLSKLLAAVAQQVRNTLYIHMVPDSLLTGRHGNVLPSSAELHRFVMSLYATSASACSSLDVRILLANIIPPSVLPPSKFHLHNGYDALFLSTDNINQDNLESYVREHFPTDSPTSCHILPSHVVNGATTSTDAINPKFNTFKSYDHVVIGGTFDNIHTGHKLLLTESCLRSNKSLTIGVTDGAMNAKKTLCELIQPVEKRISDLREFLTDVKPAIEYKLVPILDPFGPSTVDPLLECIVVSQETTRGGEAVNRVRKERGLSTLDMHEISLVEDEQRSADEETKISSSSLRKRLLGTLQKPPLKISTVHRSTYVIGLTGGIASGKSSICRRLEKLGAAVVDCDKLGHKAYLKGSGTFSKIVEVFGEEVVGPDGEIHRPSLGKKVFADKKELQRLNAIVWPAIADMVKEDIKAFAKQGKSVVLLDAAVLLEAGWQALVNEVWVTSIPRNEAIKRIVERNGLSEEESAKRIDAQLSNVERVLQANVVLSTLWEPEVTQKQVEKAWSLLEQRLPTSSNI